MATRMQQRRGTAQQWTDADPVLAAGEIGFETDSNKFKIGDGVNHWSTLKYFINLDGLDLDIDGFVKDAEKGANNGVATLDAQGQIPTSQLGNIIDGAPALLDTLNEISAAIADNESFAGTMVAALSTKAPLASPSLSGTPTAPTPSTADDSFTIATTAFVKNQGYATSTTVSDLETVVNSVSADLISTQGDVTDLQTTTTGLDSRLDAVEPALTAAEGDISGLQSGLSSAQGNITSLEGDVSTLQTNISTAQGNISTLQTDLDTAEGNITTLQTDLTTAQGNILTAQSDISTLQTDLDTAEGNISTAQGNISSLQIDMSNAQSDISTLQGDLDTAEATLATAVSDISGHSSATTTVHGIADTAALATKSYADSAANTAEGNASNALSAHASDTTGIHGITDTSKLVTTDDTGTVTSTMILDGTIVNADINASAAIAQSKIANLTTDLAAKAPLAGPTFTGTVNAADLTLSGNLTVNGTTTTVSSTNLEITDPLIYIGTGNSANANDLGVVGHFDNGTYQHTGIVRDASDGKWKLFSGVATEPTGTVDFTTYTKDSLVIGALEADSATIGNVSNTELQYLDGVTSAIQTQINAKAPSANPTFTGTVALPASSSVTINGTALSTSLDAKADKTATISSKTGAYTIASADVNTIIEFNSASGASFTIPADNSFWPVGQRLEVLQVAGGQVTIAGGAGVTVNGTPTAKTRTTWSGATVIKRAANMFVVVGDLASS